MPWRTAGSNGNVYFLHLIAPTVPPAFPSWSDPRAEAQAGDDPAAPAVPGLRRKAVKGRAGLARCSTVLQAAAQHTLCLPFLNVFKPEKQKFKGLIVFFLTWFSQEKKKWNPKCGTRPDVFTPEDCVDSNF